MIFVAKSDTKGAAFNTLAIRTSVFSLFHAPQRNLCSRTHPPDAFLSSPLAAACDCGGSVVPSRNRAGVVDQSAPRKSPLECIHSPAERERQQDGGRARQTRVARRVVLSPFPRGLAQASTHVRTYIWCFFSLNADCDARLPLLLLRFAFFDLFMLLAY